MSIIQKAYIFALISLLFLYSCDESKTIAYKPDKQSTGTVDQSTLLPQLIFFHPGTLQSLDAPSPYPTNLPPDSVHIILTFSDIMENSSEQMNNWISLTCNGIEQNFTVIPNNSSSVFEIIPDIPIVFSANYSIFLSTNVHKEGNINSTLNLAALVKPPATTIFPYNSDTLKYMFQTGDVASTDTFPPSVLLTNPIDNEINVNTTLTTSDGTIIIVFNDDSNPMINPLSVNMGTITLTHSGLGLVDGSLSMDSDDYNFKRYFFTPDLPLMPGSEYIITISVGDSIKDFSGNSVPETTYSFQTEP